MVHIYQITQHYILEDCNVQPGGDLELIMSDRSVAENSCTREKNTTQHCIPEDCNVDVIIIYNTVCSENRCALRLWYIDLVVSIEVAIEVCYCFSVFSC
jgi:hypothetical protein